MGNDENFEKHIVAEIWSYKEENELVLLTSDEIDSVKRDVGIVGVDEEGCYNDPSDKAEDKYYLCTADFRDVDIKMRPWLMKKTQGYNLVLLLPKRLLDSKKRYTDEELIMMGFLTVTSKGSRRILHDRPL